MAESVSEVKLCTRPEHAPLTSEGGWVCGRPESGPCNGYARENHQNHDWVSAGSTTVKCQRLGCFVTKGHWEVKRNGPCHGMTPWPSTYCECPSDCACRPTVNQACALHFEKCLPKQVAQNVQRNAMPRRMEDKEPPAPPERPEQVGGNHYRDLKYEPFDVIEDWSKGWPTPFTTYLIGNAMKYLARLGRKGKPASEEEAKAWMRQDLDKAIHYLKEARARM